MIFKMLKINGIYKVNTKGYLSYFDIILWEIDSWTKHDTWIWDLENIIF